LLFALVAFLSNVFSGKYGVRRVCVLDTAATSIANIITQSSVTAMLATHLQDFSGLVDLSLKELELTDLAIPIVVSHQETFWTALKVIVKHVRSFLSESSCFTPFTAHLCRSHRR
jgi:hypothetical protein